MAVQGTEHAGGAFGQQHKHPIGVWVKFLELIYEMYSQEDMLNRIEYVK
jgi:hypothetical protein